MLRFCGCSTFYFAEFALPAADTSARFPLSGRRPIGAHVRRPEHQQTNGTCPPLHGVTRAGRPSLRNDGCAAHLPTEHQWLSSDQDTSLCSCVPCSGRAVLYCFWQVLLSMPAGARAPSRHRPAPCAHREDEDGGRVRDLQEHARLLVLERLGPVVAEEAVAENVEHRRRRGEREAASVSGKARTSELGGVAGRARA